MFKKIIVANRGAVALRIIRTLREMNILSVAVYSEADKNLAYLKEADEAYLIGPAVATESYLNQENILKVAQDTKADALHPGYGFLAENPNFAQKVIAAGISFIGPDPKWLIEMGDKTASRKLMCQHNFPLAPSTEILNGCLEEKIALACSLDFPILIKPVSGGGGIGMIPVYEKDKLAKALESAESACLRSFGESCLYAEKLIANPRHVEFQIIADKHGKATHLFERDCSVQRRRQKIVEEAGAPNLDQTEVLKMAQLATQAMEKIGYDHIGTVETLYDPQSGFSFLEINPRLQVEHGVTEEITNIDIVKAQIKLAANIPLNEVLTKPDKPQGHAIEARIYAEDSARFLPSPGPLKVFRPPQGKGIRVETAFSEGDSVSMFYDPMIAQVIVKAKTRSEAIDLMKEALNDFEIKGIKSNIYFLKTLMENEKFISGDVHTGLAEEVLKTPGYSPPKNK